MENGHSVLFITPPFTQINTPYPATPYLKGFLNLHHVVSHQLDLGLEVILKIFSQEGMKEVFSEAGRVPHRLSENCRRIVAMQQEYIGTIDAVIRFLQGKDAAVAHLICGRKWLPEAGRFAQTADLNESFGTMGISDKARHLATLYLEDISDLITMAIDTDFGFSRYAERLGRSPATFTELANKLSGPETFTDRILLRLLEEKIRQFSPSVAALSVPFPGNLYSALRCGNWLKQNHPAIKVVSGGGYASTELRSITDARLFDNLDYLILDDGEVPLLNLLEHLTGKRELTRLKRTFALHHGIVHFFDGSADPDCLPSETGTPDYEGLPLASYLPVIEMANPMHRLWSDGRWNRLTLAHGCYWGKCTFCDGTLDYIRRYQPNKAVDICDRMETMIAQTGNTGFHFVDEAAPPALLRDLSLEILRRGMNVSWWTNIRFEKTFTRDLCLLIKTAGCIAVSGGLEVASDRILNLINKGVTISRAVVVANHFTRAGVLVHAYLMYGFPTQTAQETIDSLEVVRQLFKLNLVQSGFWHLFVMTAHSPVGQDPEKFGVISLSRENGSFANNDLQHADPGGCNHELFGEGLKKALYNYMHGICFDFPLQEWFEFDVPHTTLAPRYIEAQINRMEEVPLVPGTKVVWLGGVCSMTKYERTKKGKNIRMAALILHNRDREVKITLGDLHGEWLNRRFAAMSVRNREVTTIEMLQHDFLEQFSNGFDLFWNSAALKTLRENGLILL